MKFCVCVCTGILWAVNSNGNYIKQKKKKNAGELVVAFFPTNFSTNFNEKYKTVWSNYIIAG
jgi:hypothetical protein